MIGYDCHAHIFERINLVKGARYVPEAPARLAQWCQHLNEHDLVGGVLVQVSFLGTDNTQLCDALAGLDRSRFAGVAVVSPAVDDAEIDRLQASGVRGFRWNLVRGASVPSFDAPAVKRFLSHIRERGMHLELHLESPRLAPFIGPLLDTGVTVVVDHLGLPCETDPLRDPWIQAISNRRDVSGLYVKFSAQYRTPFDTLAHAAAIRSALLPDHIVWGSDWPHTQNESAVDYAQVALQRAALCVESDHEAVHALYGLAPASVD